ncbi:MAG: L,D-transpeptidase family protein [Candidatus Omnitrophica bacterium]|nr:L,D-transpeptidase family protein [Candidatus Omnitrophota bacterium]MDD5080863.1 L,D-transpeptidase family protein [Candidatus Omnitrophota bacterium]
MRKNCKRLYSFFLIFCLILCSCGKKPEQQKFTVNKEQEKVLPMEIIPEDEFQGSLLDLRKMYIKNLETNTEIEALEAIQNKIEDLNIKIIFSDIIDDCSQKYIVMPGDTLSKIAKKNGTTVGLIKRANSMDSDLIKINQKLKIHTCPFSVVVDKSQNKLFLKRKGEVIKTYTVSTGKDNSTPVGNFTIGNEKLKDPVWWKAGAVIGPDSEENILGTRWLPLVGKDTNDEDIQGYGIHGTTKPDELGMQVTAGCVRMKNQDVEDLYDLLPVGANVQILD